MLMVATMAILFTTKIFAQGTTVSTLQDVINSYLDVKNALTKDDIKGAKSASKTLAEAIRNVPMEDLQEVDHRVWMTYQDQLTTIAGEINGFDDLDQQRKSFMKLSSTFYNMVKGLNTMTSDLYYQFCPMANGGKVAYWVSDKQTIANPYFGKAMMTCGSTKETIKAKQ